MTRGEDQSQQIIADRIVGALLEIRDRREQRLDVAVDFVVPTKQLLSAQAVERAILGRCHEPSARFVGYAVDRPVFERGDERVLRKFLGEADIAQHARKTGDEFRCLDAPYRFDRAVDMVVDRRRHVMAVR